MKVSKTLFIRDQISLMTRGQIHLTSFFKQELSLYEGLKDIRHQILFIRHQISLMTRGQIHLTSFFKQELSLYEGLKDLVH